MKITDQQKEILSSFSCERLSGNNNYMLLQKFQNERGNNLIDYALRFGIEEDREGRIAYYIIKNHNDHGVLFFSLKCGTLFEPLPDESAVKQDAQRMISLLQAVQNGDGNLSDKETNEIKEMISKFSKTDQMSIEEFSKAVLKKIEEKAEYLKQLSWDMEKERNDYILRVQNTYPGIELVHFCTNETYKKEWKSLGIGHTMGEVLYWQYIAPLFFEVQNIAGCEYAFLFAADLSEDESLVNYYDVALNFEKRFDIGANKPFYDFCCDFMCQEIGEIKKSRQEYFEHFNTEQDEEIL